MRQTGTNHQERYSYEQRTWRLVDERVATHRDPRHCQADRRSLGREIGRSLARDRKRRTEEAGAAVEELVKADPPLTQEAWHRLQGWYKATVDLPPPPARATLKGVTAERTTLYRRVPPLKAVPRLLGEGWIRLHQFLHCCPRLLRPPLPVPC